MFSKTKNIDRAFKHIKYFSFLIIVTCLFVTAFVIYNNYKLAVQTQERIYILANGKALEAYSAERKDNIAVEARDHVRMFHHYFFTLDPDEKVIQSNISKALYLADASAKKQYDNLKENSYYSSIMAGNISQEIYVDSVFIDIARYPFYFRSYGTQKIIRPTTIVNRSLVTEGFLRNVARSDNNPHGFLIEKWSTLENKDIKTEKPISMLFSKKNKTKSEPKESNMHDRIAKGIAGSLLSLQTRFASFMNARTNRLNTRGKQCCLSIFCLAFGGLSIHAFIEAFHETVETTSINLDQVSIPKHIDQSGSEIKKQTVGDSDTLQIDGVKMHMDSFNRFFTGRTVYDSILTTRTGLLDSIKSFEQLYYSLSK